MGMFDFMRKKRVVVEAESIGFGDVGSWLDGKEKILRERERGVLGDAGEKLEGFYVSVEERLGVLESVDIEGKKENERAKILVRQGLDKYVGSVRVLLKELKKKSSPLAERFDLKNRKGSDSKNPEKFSFAGGLREFAVEIGETFARFEKMSFRFYERATYLIGDEMAAVRNEIRRFNNGLVGTFEGSLIGDLKRVGDVRAKLDEFDSVERSIGEVEKEIGTNDSGIDKARGKVKKLEREIEEIRNSSEYVAGLRAREEIEGLRVGLDREIGRLKELIDFKRLTSLVHSNERELGIVKDYKNHFVVEFSKDSGERLFGLMAGTSMSPRDDSGEPNSSEVGAQVDLISGLRAGLAEKRGKVGVDYTVGKLGEVKKVEESIEDFELGSVKADRRLRELRLRLKGLRNEVVLLVEGFGIVVE